MIATGARTEGTTRDIALIEFLSDCKNYDVVTALINAGKV